MAATTTGQKPGIELGALTHWIDGKSWEGPVERWGDVYNPATGQRSSRVAFATPDVVDAAVAAATAAAARWRTVSLAGRTRILFAFRELVDRHKKELAEILTREHGKVLSDAMGEVSRGLEVVEFACGIPQLLKGDFSENVSTDVDSYSIRQPLGVVAGITPFNFPAMVPMWMYPIAIACGNTFVLKPSEKDPSAADFCARLLAEAGLPDGVFNVVHGDKVAVDAILAHPGIQAVSFVGSTPIARYIYEKATAAGKRVQALGGAKNHMMVLPDADFDLAADAAVSAAYGSAGERCMAISVLVTVGDAADRLLPRIRERIGRLKVAPGIEEGAEMGPLVTKEHHARVVSYVEKGEAEGAKLLEDGRKLRVPGARAGIFPGPLPLRPGHAGHDDLQGRDLRPGPERRQDRVLRQRPSTSSTQTPGPTVWPSLPTTAAPPAASRTRCRWAWWGSTCPSPCRWPTTLLVAGRARSLETRTSTVARASTSTRGARSSPAAGPTPSTAASTWASRR